MSGDSGLFRLGLMQLRATKGRQLETPRTLEGPVVSSDWPDGTSKPPRSATPRAAGGALRVLFSFDPRRQAILLLGGDKSREWNDWYEWAVPLADDLYDEYLRELGEEGLI